MISALGLALLALCVLALAATEVARAEGSRPDVARSLLYVSGPILGAFGIFAVARLIALAG